MKSRLLLWGAIVGALVLVMTLSWSMEPSVYAQQPTPVAVTSSVNAPQVIYLLDRTVVTADRQTRREAIGQYSKADIQVVVDMATVNTTTLTLQYSNDGINWINGSAIGTALAADTNTLAQYAIFGRYLRVNVDVANSNPVTTTIIAVAK